MYVATFRLHTACLHQAMRSTGYAKPYKPLCSAVIGWFSTAVIGAFQSSLFQWVVLSVVRFFATLLMWCVSLLWASMLLEFQFHYPCWYCEGEVLCESSLWPCVCTNAGPKWLHRETNDNTLLLKNYYSKFTGIRFLALINEKSLSLSHYT